MNPSKQAMVVLASEQLWPNIQGLVHFDRHEGGIRDLCIYYTDDLQKSAEPAKRFARFTQKIFPNITVHLPGKPGGKLPQDVFQQIESWQKQLPDRRWIINATGGLKLMFAGAILAMDCPNTEVVYGELSGEWFRWKKTGQQDNLQPFSIDPSITDDIPVRYLVQAQSSIAAGREWKCESPRHLPIVELVKHGIETDWDWPDTFRRAGVSSQVNSQMQAGFLFEQFVAATLLEMGMKREQVDLNARLAEPNGQSVQEIDVIANHAGRILIFDCKLRAESEERSRVESIGSQIRQAAAIRRDIGGIGARLIMLRPGRNLREFGKLAREMGLYVIEPRDTPQFFRLLAQYCGMGPDLPPALESAQAILDEATKNGRCEFFAKSLALTKGVTDISANCVLDFNVPLNDFTKMCHQDWSACKIGSQFFLYVTVPGGLSRGLAKSRLQTRLSEIAKVRWLRISKQGKVGIAELELQPGVDLKDLRRFLSQFVGHNLIESGNSH